MKIGIFSDIHNKTEHLDTAIRQMRQLGCGHLFFLGDCTTMDTFILLTELTKGIPMDAVPGNNDDYDELRIIADGTDHVRLFREPVQLNRFGLRIFLSHSPYPALEAAHGGKTDIALFGHTHIAEVYHIGEAIVANPGELQGRTRHIGFAVLDTETKDISLYPLESE